MASPSATGLSAETRILERLESGYALPPLSAVAARLIDLASEETCSVSELARLIEQDPSLAVSLLKLANSAFFGGLQPVSTLPQAVLRVGFRELRVMALSLSLKEAFPLSKGNGFDYEAFWRVSLYRALLARALAQRVRTCNPDEAFVSALILEIGVLILHNLFPQEKTGNPVSDSSPLEACLVSEKERYAIDHRRIGEIALRYWKFPENIIACQKYYGDTALDQQVSLVKICEAARRWAERLFSENLEFNFLFDDVRQFLGVDHDVVNEMMAGAFEQVEEISKVLRIRVEREKDLLGLMEKANRALGRLSERISAPGPDKPLPTFAALMDGGVKPDEVAYTLEAVAHEIRNPLVAVAGFARRLSRVVDPSSSGGKYIDIILQEAERLEAALSMMTSRTLPDRV